jgi:UDP-N-acetylglucosamine pyrophosphorylase
VKALVAADALQAPVLVTERFVPGLGHALELETAAGAAIEFFSRAVGVRVPRSRFLPVKSTGDLLAVTSNLYELRHGEPLRARARACDRAHGWHSSEKGHPFQYLPCSSADSRPDAHKRALYARCFLLNRLPRLTSPRPSLPIGSLVVSPRREAPSPPVIKLGPEFAHLAGYNERLPHLPDCVDLEHLTVSGNVFFGKGVVLQGTVIIVAENGARIDVPDGSVLRDKVISGALRIVDH